jgi:hypothetical protein
LSIISGLLFFWYWNYAVSDNDGNCEEIFLSRITTICIMFGELHQLYVLAYSLGLGGIKVALTRTLLCSLEMVLTISTFAVAITVLLSYFFFRNVLMSIEHAWTAYISLAQLYIISKARFGRDTLRDTAVVAVTDSSVSIFEKLSVTQLVLSGIALAYRIGTDILGARLIGSIELTLNVLDMVCTLIFYLKTLLIKERTNVNLSVV